MDNTCSQAGASLSAPMISFHSVPDMRQGVGAVQQNTTVLVI